MADHLKRLKYIDFIQLSWFSLRGRPVEKIYDLFHKEKVLSVCAAKKLCLIDSYYSKGDFRKDRRRIKKIKN